MLGVTKLTTGFLINIYFISLVQLRQLLQDLLFQQGVLVLLGVAGRLGKDEADQFLLPIKNGDEVAENRPEFLQPLLFLLDEVL